MPHPPVTGPNPLVYAKMIAEPEGETQMKLAMITVAGVSMLAAAPASAQTTHCYRSSYMSVDCTPLDNGVPAPSNQPDYSGYADALNRSQQDLLRSNRESRERALRQQLLEQQIELNRLRLEAERRKSEQDDPDG